MEKQRKREFYGINMKQRCVEKCNYHNSFLPLNPTKGFPSLILFHVQKSSDVNCELYSVIFSEACGTSLRVIKEKPSSISSSA